MKKNITDFINKKTTKWFYDELYWINIYVVELKWKKQQTLLDNINKYVWKIDTEISRWKMLSIDWYYLIVMENLEDINTLVHELIHVVFDLFADRDIPIELGNDEVFAYYYTYLYNSITKLISN